MKLSVNRKYAFFFGAISLAIIAAVVLSFSAVVLKEGDSLRRQIEKTETEIYEESQGKTLFNIAKYLSQNLFIPLYNLDIEAVNRLIRDMKSGLPIKSFLVADESGKVLTDGSAENHSFGKRLRANLRSLDPAVIIVDRIPNGQKITFTIKTDARIAGYGEIVFSDEPLKGALRKHKELVSTTWEGFSSAFIRVSIIGILVVLIIAAALSLVFSRTLSSPLMRLSDAVNRIAKGDLTASVEIASGDEIGELADSFNRMVSDLKKSTEGLREANEKLRALDQLKSDVVSLVSHELRTPLTSIKAFTEIILMKPHMPADRKIKLLRTINNESDRLARLINDILDLTKIEEGKMSWNISELSIESVIRSAVEGIHPLADNKGLAVAAQIEPALPNFFGDRDRLIQVVTNILSNAIKFTPTGGSVRIHAYQEQNPRRQIAVEISDTGVGIPEEHLGMIFEKFHRSCYALTANTEGTGLGLTITRLIVEYHGGAIWATSNLGVGSAFTFTLPLDKAWDNEGEQRIV